MDRKLSIFLHLHALVVFYALARHATMEDAHYHIEPLCRYPWTCQYGTVPRIKPNISSM